ncbi:Putative uncharacterized protein [Taphrina deformans PYCC 5710]|uniref:Peroxisomal membrane protein PEX14-like KPWE domain-containing protein n=1 Tax=Taphrina deformans (strain PYCC 5710 / ATCC 11124 / CBS 356.35 / IMI 108563 / JCM 9778 / NBRC 8474) TaxID=1097556 RepID=R4XB73_TAPDE|nr:Putative uncharacterized protein [Taphrina deformans PYCC 5710]|eukprot:CCG80568.1 Putative uncharacterized protein [Taphrina deformans PYCC 5710]
MTPEADADIPYPASFAEIVDLISSGKPIPGIKLIPDKIADGEVSVSTSEVRTKPWESDGEATEVSFF